MERDTRGEAQPRVVVPFARTGSERNLADSPCTFGDERRDASDSFDLAFNGDHDIEYWIWNGVRLVPALPDEVERIQQREAQIVREATRTNERYKATRRKGSSVTDRRGWLLDSMCAALVAIVRPFRSNPKDPGDTLGRGA